MCKYSEENKSTVKYFIAPPPKTYQHFKKLFNLEKMDLKDVSVDFLSKCFKSYRHFLTKFINDEKLRNDFSKEKDYATFALKWFFRTISASTEAFKISRGKLSSVVAKEEIKLEEAAASKNIAEQNHTALSQLYAFFGFSTAPRPNELVTAVSDEHLNDSLERRLSSEEDYASPGMAS